MFFNWRRKKWIVHLVVVSGKLVGGNSVGTSDWDGVIVAGKLFSVKTVGGVVVVVGAAALAGGGGNTRSSLRTTKRDFNLPFIPVHKLMALSRSDCCKR